MRSATPSATTTTGRRRAWSTPFSVRSRRRIHLCLRARDAARRLPAHDERARRGLHRLQAAQGKARIQDPLADRDGNAAQFEHEAPDAFRHGHQKGRKVAPGAHGQGKEALYLRRHGLRVRKVSGAGLYAKGAGYCLCRGRPAGRADDSGNGCEKQVRQICASGHGTCRNAGSWHVWQAAQLSDMILFHTRVCENGKKMEQPLENK